MKKHLLFFFFCHIIAPLKAMHIEDFKTLNYARFNKYEFTEHLMRFDFNSQRHENFFIVPDSDEKPVLLIPLLERTSSEQELNKVAANLLLICSAQMGDVENFNKALDYAADIKYPDKRANSLVFFIENIENRQKILKKDLHDYRITRLSRLSSPGYPDTHGLTAPEIAMLCNQCDILEDIKNNHKDKIHAADLEIINNYLKEWKSEEDQLAKKLQENRIFNPELNTQIIKKYAFLNDLAHSYANIIATQQEDGKKLLNHYAVWQNEYPLFKLCIFKHIYLHMAESEVAPKIIPENIAQLIAQQPPAKKYFFWELSYKKYARVFFDYALRYFGYFAHQTNAIAWKKNFRDTVQHFSNDQTTNWLLKELCRDPRYKENVQKIVQEHLFHKTIMRGIDKPNQHINLPIPIIKEIMAYIEPNQESLSKFKDHLAQDFSVKK